MKQTFPKRRSRANPSQIILSRLKHATYIVRVSTSILTDIFRLGEAEKSRHGSHTSRASYPFGKEPLGTYAFKYRSHSTYLLRLCREGLSSANLEVLIIRQETFKSKESLLAVRPQFRLRIATHKISRLKKHESLCVVCVRVEYPE